MDLHLSGKTAVVTGASKGIGLAITQALAGQGVTVVAGARESTAELSELARSATVLPVPVDLATPGGPGRLIEAAVATFGGLDILVNNVGADTNGFLSVTDDDWTATLAVKYLPTGNAWAIFKAYLDEAAPADRGSSCGCIRR